ncbi:MAG: DUF5060 domain-containing protein [Lishizhenia sp.]
MKQLLTPIFCLLLTPAFLQVLVYEDNTQPVFSEIVLYNQMQTDSLACFGKLELGLKIQPEIQERINAFVNKDKSFVESYAINPFLSWELRVVATFTHQETGEIKQVDGFYFENFRQDERSNAWKQLKENYKFRVRFTPEKVGLWNTTISVYLKNKEVQKASNFSFNVVESELHGFVKVHENKKHFSLDNEIITPVGINLPWPVVGSNTEYDYREGQQVYMSVWRNYHKDLKAYTEMPGKNKSLRILLSESSMHIEFEELGNYYGRLNYAWEIDKLVEQCEITNTLIDFNLQLHSPLMKFASYYYFIYDFAKSHPADNYPVSPYAKLLNSETPSDMFMEEIAMKYLKEKHRYIIARWGYSTAIMLFELLSEPWHLNEDAALSETNEIINQSIPYDEENGNLERKAVHKFHKEMSAYIKEELKHDQHLLGAVGHLPYAPESVYSPIAKNVAVQDSSWHLNNIDVICISAYDSSADKYIKSKSSNKDFRFDEGENSVARRINNLQNTYHKPIYFSEFGPSGKYDLCSNLNGSKIDLLKAGSIGLAGFNTWYSYFYGPDHITDERDSWKIVSALNRFYNTNEAQQLFSDSNYIQGRERTAVKTNFSESNRERLKEMQYLVTADKSLSMGYLHNKTFNIETALYIDTNNLDKRINLKNCEQNKVAYKQPLLLDWKNGKLTLEGLKRKSNYTFSFFGYENLELVSILCLKSNWWGKIRVEHPTLGATYLTNPIYLFSAKEEDCK